MRTPKALKGAGALLAMVALAAGASACVKSNAGSTADGLKLAAAGKLTVCTHLPFKPFQVRDTKGAIVGFDVDYMDLVAKKLGLTQTIVDTPFEGIKSGQDLKIGKCDVAAAGMTITKTRQQVMDFSVPYFDNTQSLLVKAGQPYKTLADFKGKKIGGEVGNTGLKFAQNNAAKYGFTVVEYQDTTTLQQALATNQIQGAMDDLPIWTVLVAEDKRFTIATKFATNEQYGYSVAKGANPKLLATVNEVITSSLKDGSYAKLYTKWMQLPAPSPLVTQGMTPPQD
ncbi:ABC transporter substrate-binding protein [Fodinicola feengrottensis]|uniref:Solute-binding protein family 3/N-terminal domain-containing protein n=1 Tax=Fodinicola feengrottensis TaxID=435914 RepID=A0ABP4T192_9ACTN|nr:ABC transporter substrate-binding protein [Fodinicola feengrottensis]